MIYMIGVAYRIILVLMVVAAMFFVARPLFAQTAILTPSGNYICNPMGFVTSCAGPEGGLSILQLGPQTYAVTPMTPIVPQYPTLDEPRQHRESSTPMFLSPSESKPERQVDSDPFKTPCLSLFNDC